MCLVLNNKIFQVSNSLLVLLFVITLTLTFYSCSHFYTFLPISDTWVHTDFLAQAAQGHLVIGELFEKHNNVHLIVLPKLVYFLDMWLSNGSGIVVMLLSLTAMLATAGIFIAVITSISDLDKHEKIWLGLFCSIVLLSACQVESLLNPANIQWSLLTFSATLTAWFFYRYDKQKTAINIFGIAVGVVLTALTSATVLLIVVPLAILLLVNRFGKTKVALAVIVISISITALYAIAEFVRWMYFPESNPLLLPIIKAVSSQELSASDEIEIFTFFYNRALQAHLFLLMNWLKFVIDFIAPPIERLHFTFASAVGALFFGSAFIALITGKNRSENSTGCFFSVLLLFSLLTIITSGLIRAHSQDAFTFRFVNIGLLVAATLFPLLYFQVRQSNRLRGIIIGAALIYSGILTWVNFTEASAFGYGRNHVRLTQVAYALDINDSFVVASMPGTVWEKIDFDFVQANKHKLRNVGTGVYGSEEYKRVGRPISVLGNLEQSDCKTEIIKMRRLLSDQAAYRLLGESRTDDNEILSRVYFVDDENIIRGYAIPFEPSRNLLVNTMHDSQWAGFVNLEQSKVQNSLTLFAYNNARLCKGEKILLPEFSPPKKKGV